MPHSKSNLELSVWRVLYTLNPSLSPSNRNFQLLVIYPTLSGRLLKSELVKAEMGLSGISIFPISDGTLKLWIASACLDGS